MLSTADGLRRPVAEGGALDRSWSRPRDIVVFEPRSQSRSRRTEVRRALNLAVAIVAVILVAPVMLIVALLVKLSSPGPVFYRQTRVGIDRRTGSGGNFRRRIDYGGRLFTIYKFRTMYVEPEGEAKQCWATKNDPRVTPIGRFLRQTRLDELPQLFNVIKGDMNVVGPRPEQPNIFLQLREQVDDYARRQRVLPGITGWAQVNLQYDQNVDDVRRKVQLDLEYASRMSAAEDLRIMLRTVPVMLLRGGGW
jgi:lipopolysaccharide/colanic/teichoic acid biosynthesis glycosyltransferase